jgi:hypothetical protein
VAVDDFSQLDAFADVLARAVPAILPKVRPVVSKGALNIKNQLRAEAERSPHFKGLAWTVSYDITDGPDGVEAEIGPEKKAAGNLGNIAYFGGAHGGGASLPDPEGALEAETDRFMAALEMVVDL